ncbi:hypothetical protein KCU61_g709, partial [Aureobasidium melanogenum]
MMDGFMDPDVITGDAERENHPVKQSCFQMRPLIFDLVCALPQRNFVHNYIPKDIRRGPAHIHNEYSTKNENSYNAWPGGDNGLPSNSVGGGSDGVGMCLAPPLANAIAGSLLANEVAGSQAIVLSLCALRILGLEKFLAGTTGGVYLLVWESSGVMDDTSSSCCSLRRGGEYIGAGLFGVVALSSRRLLGDVGRMRSFQAVINDQRNSRTKSSIPSNEIMINMAPMTNTTAKKMTSTRTMVTISIPRHCRRHEDSNLPRSHPQKVAIESSWLMWQRSRYSPTYSLRDVEESRAGDNIPDDIFDAVHMTDTLTPYGTCERSSQQECSRPCTCHGSVHVVWRNAIIALRRSDTVPTTLSQPATVPSVSKSGAPNTMLDKADNITGKSDLDSAANRDGHRYLTLVSTSTMAVDHP